MTIDFPPRPSNRAVLLSRIQSQDESLRALMDRIGPENLTEILKDWSVKDHIAHVTAWLGAARAVLQGKRMWEGLGLPERPANPRDWDAINATLYGLWREKPLDDVLTRWRTDHAATVAAIESATEAQLPGAHGEPDAPEGRTLMDVVSANTYEHYLEHETWIREQLAERGKLPGD